ncbi:hypothetical protein F4677DRAFT_419683 [Hypoxylon crocopeplum]|nr:hypothetical protein F4677DRAFT_419683 [Hypoxylon crocopeplum]
MAVLSAFFFHLPFSGSSSTTQGLPPSIQQGDPPFLVDFICLCSSLHLVRSYIVERTPTVPSTFNVLYIYLYQQALSSLQNLC